MISYLTLSVGLSELVATVLCVSHIPRGMGDNLLFWHWYQCDFCPSELHHWATGQESAPERRLLDHVFTASRDHRDSLPTGKETLLMADFSICSISNLCSHWGPYCWERKVSLRRAKITPLLTAYPLEGEHPKDSACLYIGLNPPSASGLLCSCLLSNVIPGPQRGADKTPGDWHWLLIPSHTQIRRQS